MRKVTRQPQRLQAGASPASTVLTRSGVRVANLHTPDCERVFDSTEIDAGIESDPEADQVALTKMAQRVVGVRPVLN